MIKKQIFSFLLGIIALFFLFPTVNVNAITLSASPASLVMEDLLPSGTYTYTFEFRLKEIENDVKVLLTTELGDMDGWINFDVGNEFSYKKDQEKQVIVATINIPTEAIIKNYTGAIRLNVDTDDNQSMTSVVSGTKIDVNLSLTSNAKEFLEIASAEVPNFKVGNPFLLKMNLHNIGNVQFAVNKITMQIFTTDNTEVANLSSLENVLINAFSYKEVSIEFQNSLKEGSYTALVKLFNGDKLAFEKTVPLSAEKNSIAFSIFPEMDPNLSTVLIILIVVGFLILAYIVFIGMKNNEKKNVLAIVILSLLVLPIISYLGYQYQEYLNTSSMIEEHKNLVALKTTSNSQTAKSTDVLGVSTETDPTENVTEENEVDKNMNNRGEFYVFDRPDYASEIIHLLKSDDTVKATEDLGEWFKVTINSELEGYLPKISVKSVQ
jgi:hypothetical protein